MTQNPYSQPPQPQQQPQYTQWQQVPPPMPRRSSWPTVIGVISISLASLGLICIPISVAGTALSPSSPQIDEFMPAWFSVYQMTSYAISMGMSVLLLVAGILLLKRRPAGRTLHLVHAMISMVMAVFGAVITVMIVSRMAEGAPAPMRAAFIGGAIGGTVFGMAYPIFLLVWFFRRKIVDEVYTWTAVPTAAADPYAQQPPPGPPM